MKYSLGCLILLFCVFSMRTAHSDSSSTTFDPEKDGFKFPNADFQAELIADIRTKGWCGGFIYSALDYFLDPDKRTPDIDYKPPTNKPLYNHLYNRWSESIYDHFGQWIELKEGRLGAIDRRAEFFRRGLEGSANSHLRYVVDKINRNIPVPIGLLHRERDSSDHVVLVIGYDLGRYNFDLGDYMEEVKLYVYDPNSPNKTKTLVPLPNLRSFEWENRIESAQNYGSGRWITYFPLRNYSKRTPPSVKPIKNYPDDGNVYEFMLHTRTGHDDLRSDRGEFDVQVYFKDSTKQIFKNASAGAHYMDNTGHNIRLFLDPPKKVESLSHVFIVSDFDGGLNGDNWDMKKIIFEARGGERVGNSYRKRILYSMSSDPVVHRFKGGSRDIFSFPLLINPNGVHGLNIMFKTGNDDLRGGNDNVHAKIEIKNRANPLKISNLNDGRKFDANSTNKLYFPFHPALNDVKDLLTAEFKISRGSDNWDLNKLEIEALKGTSNTEVSLYSDSGRPLHRFKGGEPNRSLKVPITIVPRYFVNKVKLKITTGSDDLKGGDDDNLSVRVRYKDGTSQFYNNVNSGQSWSNNSYKIVTLPIVQPKSARQFKEIMLTTGHCSGSCDNWNLQKIIVEMHSVDGEHIDVNTQSGNPLKRFTGSSYTKFFSLLAVELLTYPSGEFR